MRDDTQAASRRSATADSLRPLIYGASPRMETGNEGAGEESRFVVLSFYQFAGNTCTQWRFACLQTPQTHNGHFLQQVRFFLTSILQILTGKRPKSSLESI